MARRVLVVEDEASLQLLIKDNLEMEGLDVVCASTGRAALELAWKALPDVALVDIGLPDMTGWDVCERLRADFRTKNVVLVIVSAESRGVVTSKLAALKLRHFVSKPYDPIAVGQLVKSL